MLAALWDTAVLATSFWGASQLLGANTIWKEENTAFPSQVLVAPCAAPEGSRLLPGPGTGTSSVLLPLAALKRGELALLAPSPALSLLPELLSLHKYAFINQAVFV